MDGEDEEFADAANRTMTTSVRKTAPHMRIPSYYEFATHTLDTAARVITRRTESHVKLH